MAVQCALLTVAGKDPLDISVKNLKRFETLLEIMCTLE